MNKYKLLKEYVEAHQHQTEYNDKLRELSHQYGVYFDFPENNRIEIIKDNILRDWLGETNYEELMWWMWDTEFGKKNTEVTFPDNRVVDVTSFDVLYNEMFSFDKE